MLSWEMRSKKIFFCMFCFDKGYFKRVHRPIFNFSAQSHNFTGGSTEPDLP